MFAMTSTLFKMKINLFVSDANTSKTQKSKIDKPVPLHTGSTVYVSKNDLMKIYSDKPDVYIKRLADLIFGTEIRTTPGNVRNTLDALDATRLKSFISKIQTNDTRHVIYCLLILNIFF